MTRTGQDVPNTDRRSGRCSLRGVALLAVATQELGRRRRVTFGKIKEVLDMPESHRGAAEVVRLVSQGRPP